MNLFNILRRKTVLILGLANICLMHPLGTHARESEPKLISANYDGRYFSSSKDGLELIAELVFLPARSVSSASKEAEGTLRVSVWLANKSVTPIRLITASRKHGFRLSGKTLLFSYAPSELKDMIIREEDGRLGIVELKPNEAVAIESESIPIDDIYAPNLVYNIAYIVDQRCRTIYGVWTGEFECSIDLNTAKSQARVMSKK